MTEQSSPQVDPQARSRARKAVGVYGFDRLLLFIALKRGDKAPDARHPVGYGRETYFWALLACLALDERRVGAFATRISSVTT